MIRVAILYPNTPGSRFDVGYYRDRHLGRLARELLGPALKGIEVDVGVSGRDGPAPYHAIGYLMFDSLPEFQAAFAPVAARLAADVPNYTDLAPQVQISRHEKI